MRPDKCIQVTFLTLKADITEQTDIFHRLITKT